MKRSYYLAAAMICSSLILAGCQSTTAGGATDSSRKQIMLISSAEVNQGAELAYKKELDKARSAQALNTNAPYTKQVKTISSRLIAQVGIFRPDAKNWKWEANVFSSDAVNAYCMPGGKIVVYTGIISKLNLTDDELAAVIGHEIAHALREHSREQISQQVAKDQVIAIGGRLAGLGSAATSMANMASQYVLTLPFSRTMEREADVIGMELMARAGYNPNGAISIWKKMQELGGSSTPELLSTHPSDSSRIENLEKELPKVMPLYEAAIQKTTILKAPKKVKGASKALSAR